MTGIRRSLLLLALAVAAVIGALGPAHPAQATFNERVTAAATQISTATVGAASSPTASLTCTRSGATLSASWKSSTTARVDGYLLTVVFSDGYVQAVDGLVTGTTWSTPMSLVNATTYSMYVTVTAHTDYGWTSTIVTTGSVRC